MASVAVKMRELNKHMKVIVKPDSQPARTLMLRSFNAIMDIEMKD